MNTWAVQFDEPVPYSQGLNLQHRLLKARQADEIPDTVLILQHTPTVTLGNRGRDNYLLKTPEEYEALGIEVFHAERQTMQPAQVIPPHQRFGCGARLVPRAIVASRNDGIDRRIRHFDARDAGFEKLEW